MTEIDSVHIEHLSCPVDLYDQHCLPHIGAHVCRKATAFDDADFHGIDEVDPHGEGIHRKWFEHTGIVLRFD